MTRIPIEKEFVIRHVFDDPRFLDYEDSWTEMRYNIPWCLEAYQKRQTTYFSLNCLLEKRSPGWSIDFDYELKFVGKQKSFTTKGSDLFRSYGDFVRYSADYSEYKPYMVNGKLKVEWRIKINKMVGFEALEDPDSAVLWVGGEQIKVDKKLLADNCTYFNTIFFKSSDDWGKPEIEVEDCKNPNEFKIFLEILKSEQEIDEKSINVVLDLSAKFGSNPMLTKCEEFLLEKSENSIKMKFNLAIEYKLNKLKKSILSNIKSKEDLAELGSENASHFNVSVWKELFQKAISIN
ncbi:unnamed protein product [Caenorhabditis nigoni]